jgi:hypothetical protein
LRAETRRVWASDVWSPDALNQNNAAVVLLHRCVLRSSYRFVWLTPRIGPFVFIFVVFLFGLVVEILVIDLVFVVFVFVRALLLDAHYVRPVARTIGDALLV